MASAIPATAIPNSWTAAACRPCWPWPMPDRAPLEEERPVEAPFLPYGKQEIADADIRAVVEALVSGWLTTGPRVPEFEKAFAAHAGAGEGGAVEVIVPAIPFAASANAALYEGGTPVFADVEADTLLIDPASVEARIT